MDKQNLQDKLNELEKEFENRKKLIIKEYCDLNNPYRLGDKFTDHIGTIMIEKISYYTWGFGVPCCIYFGPELKKDGTPKKNGNKRKAWQLNDVNTSQNNQEK